MKNFLITQSYWALANEYFLSAETLLNSVVGKKKVAPILLLQCHAIELGLKSFLFFVDLKKSEIRNLGHDLCLCLSRALQLGLQIDLSDEQLIAIKDANQLYKLKRLEYFYEESKVLDSVNRVQVIAKTLLSDVFDHVTRPNFEAMKQH